MSDLTKSAQIAMLPIQIAEIKGRLEKHDSTINDFGKCMVAVQKDCNSVLEKINEHKKIMDRVSDFIDKQSVKTNKRLLSLEIFRIASGLIYSAILGIIVFFREQWLAFIHFLNTLKT